MTRHDERPRSCDSPPSGRDPHAPSFVRPTQGVLSEKDVIHFLREYQGGDDTSKLRTKVSEIMSRPVLSVLSTSPLAFAVSQMLEKKVHRLVVVAPDSGKACGMITRSDVFSSVAQLATAGDPLYAKEGAAAALQHERDARRRRGERSPSGSVASFPRDGSAAGGDGRGKINVFDAAAAHMVGADQDAGGDEKKSASLPDFVQVCAASRTHDACKAASTRSSPRRGRASPLLILCAAHGRGGCRGCSISPKKSCLFRWFSSLPKGTMPPRAQICHGVRR